MNNEQTLKALGLCGGFLSPLTRSQFRISGTDRTRYLNSQLSNDLHKAVPNTTLPSCLLNAKGKMCALVWVLQQEDTWLIDADRELRIDLQARLERYIVADDVHIEDISDTGMLFHIFGPAASHLPEVQSAHNSRLGLSGKDAWIPTDQTESFYKDLIHKGVLEVTKNFSEPLRIAQGIPAWGTEISENTFPAEARLDSYAVDFAKGCYVGQEIVSRIRSVGRVPRRLTGFIAENSTDILAPHSQILEPISKVCVGVLTSTAYHFEFSRMVALGYIKSAISASTGIFLAIHPQSGEETPLRMREFPLTNS